MEAEMRNKLQRAIIALAQQAEVQLSLFPDFVCKADELALDFEDGLYEMVGHEAEFTEQQKSAVTALDALITSMSGQANTDFWTDDALRTNPTWEQIRALARIAAATFGWDSSAIPQSDHVYVRGGR
jgi:hypothetical protein